jgi:hypothetical protein
MSPPWQHASLHLRFEARRAAVEKLEDVGMIARQQSDSLLIVIQEKAAGQSGQCQQYTQQYCNRKDMAPGEWKSDIHQSSVLGKLSEVGAVRQLSRVARRHQDAFPDGADQGVASVTVCLMHAREAAVLAQLILNIEPVSERDSSIAISRPS